MKFRQILILGIVLSGCALILGNIGAPEATSVVTSTPNASPNLDLRRLPLWFEANANEAGAPGPEYLARGSRYTIYLESSAAVFLLDRPGAESSTILRMGLEGASLSAPLTAEEKLVGVSHYFIGADPESWRTNVPHYARVRAADVYPGIDVVYYGNQNELEFDLEVGPGADPSAIVLTFEGARGIEIGQNGDLLADLGDGEVRLRRPIVYQGLKEDPQRVEAGFILLAEDRVGFAMGAYDPTRPLVVDPSIAYGTFFGSGGWEFFQGIAVDQAGCLYVQGSTQSLAFPVSNALYATAPGGLFDVFVSKLNATGETLLFSTYFGGSGRDTGSGIAVDADGDIYITGDTDSSNFPRVTPLQATFGGNGSVGFGDAFLTKMKSDGSALVYSTYLGGNRDDLAMGIALDAEKNVYVTGVTESGNFPISNAYQATYGGGGLDAFVSCVNPAGSAFVYSTYLGGNGTETSYGFGQGDIAVTADGYACVVGYTNSSNFPLANAYQSTYGGGGTNSNGDVFITKFDPSGASLVFSTYLGGSNDDLGQSIAVDAGGAVYVAGKTKSANFPTKNPYQGTYGGGDADGFIAAFSSDGKTLIYSSYFGWSGYDSVSDVTANDLGNAYIVGGVDSTSFPTVNPIQGTMSGPGDAYISVFSADGASLLFSTYLGGTGGDGASYVRLDKDGNIYIAGGASAGFPVKNALMPNPPSPTGGLFMAKIEDVTFVPGPVLTSLLPSTAAAGDPGFLLRVIGSDFDNGAVVRWDSSDRPTTFVSGAEVDATIGVSDLAAGKSVQVTVRNPDTGVSNALAFTIDNPAPTLNSLSPTGTSGGGAGFALTVRGSNFVPNSVVCWNGNGRVTTYVSATEIQGAILATDIESGGEAQVTVLNPSPAGGTSSAIAFPVSSYTVGSSSSSATVTAGQPATYTIQLTPVLGSFDSAISLSCIGLPSKCTSTFLPATVTPGAAAATTTLTLTTTAPTASAAAGLSGSAALLPPAAGLLMLVLALLIGPRPSVLLGRRASRRWLAACALVFLVIAIGSCSSGGDNPPSSTGTPKGTHSITVQAVSGTLRVTTAITLIVQ